MISDTQRTNKLILVVEDEDDLRTILKAILTKKGYSVVEARDGQEALDLLSVIERGPPVSQSLAHDGHLFMRQPMIGILAQVACQEVVCLGIVPCVHGFVGSRIASIDPLAMDNGL